MVANGISKCSLMSKNVLFCGVLCHKIVLLRYQIIHNIAKWTCTQTKTLTHIAIYISWFDNNDHDSYTMP